MARVKSTLHPRQAPKVEVSWPNNIALHADPLNFKANKTQRMKRGPRKRKSENYTSNQSLESRITAPSSTKPKTVSWARLPYRTRKFSSAKPRLQKSKAYKRSSKPKKPALKKPTQPPQTNKPKDKNPIITPSPSPDPAFTTAITRYNTAYESRLRLFRKWVSEKHHSHRIDHPVAQELYAYFGARKFGSRPSANSLSKHAYEALELSEWDLGTDFKWAKSQSWIFEGVSGGWRGVFEGMVERGEAEYGGLSGPGYVGEEDLESWVGEDEGEGMQGGVGSAGMRSGGEGGGEGGETGGGVREVEEMVIDWEI